MDALSRPVDPELIAAWLTARSIARSLPAPVGDRGGYRVDTGAETEIRRWVFPIMTDGLAALGREIAAPFHLLKLCGTGEMLMAALPDRWRLQSLSHVMSVEAAAGAVELPTGYRLERLEQGARTEIRILDAEGVLAASGHAAEAADVFIYDRIETVVAHRRKGLGRALMAALGAARRSSASTQILVATQEGRRLYESLGWSVYSPYATAALPAA